MDSTTFSFASYTADVTEIPLRFYVRTIGGVTNYPRRYALAIDEAVTTAVEGVDFSLSRNDFIIHPGETMDTCIVTLIRTPALRQSSLVLKLRLQPNENFDIIFDSYRNSGSWEIPLILCLLLPMQYVSLKSIMNPVIGPGLAIVILDHSHPPRCLNWRKLWVGHTQTGIAEALALQSTVWPYGLCSQGFPKASSGTC